MNNKEWLKDSEENRAIRFNCTVEQLRAHYQQNLVILQEMLGKAESTGKKVNGYSADKLRGMVSDHQNLAEGNY